MNILKVNFQEIYDRHLCRHSQFGINLIHLAAVGVTYLALFAIAARFPISPWILLAIPAAYAVALAFNVPFHVLAACVVFMALFFGVFLTMPPVPIWLSIVLIIASHQVQNLSHRIYRVERDMTEFNQKYKKGPVLFVLLSLYELPILLNYLVFDRKQWAT
jgi:hypothetical protein